MIHLLTVIHENRQRIADSRFHQMKRTQFHRSRCARHRLSARTFFAQIQRDLSIHRLPCLVEYGRKIILLVRKHGEIQSLIDLTDIGTVFFQLHGHPFAEYRHLRTEIGVDLPDTALRPPVEPHLVPDVPLIPHQLHVQRFQLCQIFFNRIKTEFQHRNMVCLLCILIPLLPHFVDKRIRYGIPEQRTSRLPDPQFLRIQQMFQSCRFKIAAAPPELFQLRSCFRLRNTDPFCKLRLVIRLMTHDPRMLRTFTPLTDQIRTGLARI